MAVDDSALLFPVGGAEERRHVRRQDQRRRREGRHCSDQDRRSGKQTELRGQYFPLDLCYFCHYFFFKKSCFLVPVSLKLKGQVCLLLVLNIKTPERKAAQETEFLQRGLMWG